MPQRTFFSRLKPCTITLALVLTAFICSPASAGEKAIMVLDASGSMWGRLDGTPKIEIARNTLVAVLGKIP